MLARIEREVHRAPGEPDLGAKARQVVIDMAEAVLLFRASRLDDAHDHRLLHPARTLILLLEAGGADPESLSAAPMLESRFPDLVPPRAHWPHASGSGQSPVLELLGQIPRPGRWPETAEGHQRGKVADHADRQELSQELGAELRGAGPQVSDDSSLLEHLVALQPEHLRLALCEMLDQLRHLHVEPGRPALARGVELARNVYTPLAIRLAKRGKGDPGAARLARRFHQWQDRLGRVTGT